VFVKQDYQFRDQKVMIKIICYYDKSHPSTITR